MDCDMIYRSQRQYSRPHRLDMHNFALGDRLISRVRYHPEGFTGGAVGDDS